MVHSFLLIGQSNMAGRGSLREAPPLKDARILVLRNGRWQEAYRPVNGDRSFRWTRGFSSAAGVESRAFQLYLRQRGAAALCRNTPPDGLCSRRGVDFQFGLPALQRGSASCLRQAVLPRVPGTGGQKQNLSRKAGRGSFPAYRDGAPLTPPLDKRGLACYNT